MKPLTLVVLMGLLRGAAALAAEQPESPPGTPSAQLPETGAAAPKTDVVDQGPQKVDYLLPDAPHKLLTFDGERVSLRLAFALILDYTFISQNAVSEAQVGKQASSWDLRAARIVAFGELKFAKPWTYLVAYDFNELREPEDRVLDPYDFALTIPLWAKARIAIGRQKEPFVYEMVSDSASLPQLERIMNPFFVNRNIGLRYSDNFLQDRISLSLGVFDDWFMHGISFADSGVQALARLTGLPILSEDGSHYLHLGAAYRYRGAEEGKLRFKGRPESNVTDYYVDTADFPALGAHQLSLEAVYVAGPLSLFGEYDHAWVSAPERGDPAFAGFFVGASWVLTGEHRPYDAKVGFARRIIPTSRYGALEVTARFSWLDFDSAQITGGRLAKWSAAVNWWASTQLKFGCGYGNAELNKETAGGRTQLVLLRAQWIY